MRGDAFRAHLAEGVKRIFLHPPGLLRIGDHLKQAFRHCIRDSRRRDRLDLVRPAEDDDTRVARARILVLEQSEDQMVTGLCGDLAGGHVTHALVGMARIHQQHLVCHLGITHPAPDRRRGVGGQLLCIHVLSFPVLVLSRDEREERLVRRRAPGTLGQLVRLTELRSRRAGQAQGLARDGVCECDADAPLTGIVIAASANMVAHDTHGAIMMPGEFVEPLTVVHELAVLQRLLLGHQPHRGTAPDLADAAAGVAVEHPGGGVEALNRLDIPRLGID